MDVPTRPTLMQTEMSTTEPGASGPFVLTVRANPPTPEFGPFKKRSQF